MAEANLEARQETGTAKRGPGRPTDQNKTRHIVETARALFFERGIEAVSIEEIAGKAGVAKTTIYGRFGGKDGLFDAVLEAIATPVEEGVAAGIAPDDPIETTLRDYGVRLLTALAERRLMGAEPFAMMEAARNPALGERLFEAGPGRVRRVLAAAIATWAEAGRLRVDDPVCAAEDLIGLWQGTLSFEIRLKPGTSLGEAEIVRHVDRGVRNFMALYGVQSGERGQGANGTA